MADEILKFYDKIYVGIEEAQQPDLEKPPLGFATPYAEDAAFRKRRETVDSWSKRRSGLKYDDVYEGHVFDNKPISGFKVDSAVERYRTNNKLIQIVDPRGFQLQISVWNLMDVLQHAAIEDGRFIGDYLWGRWGSENFLCREDHPSYLEHLAPKIERTKLQPGDVIRIHDAEYIYVTSAFFYLFGAGDRYFLPNGTMLKKEPNYWERSQCQLRTVTLSKHDKTPWAIFLPVKRIDDPYMDRHFLIRRMPSKPFILREGETIYRQFEFGKKHNLYGSSDLDSGLAFETREELMEYELDFDILAYEKSYRSWLEGRTASGVHITL